MSPATSQLSSYQQMSLFSHIWTLFTPSVDPAEVSSFRKKKSWTSPTCGLVGQGKAPGPVTPHRLLVAKEKKQMHKWLSRAGLWSAVSEATRCNWCCIKQDEVSLFDTKSRCHRVSFVSNMSGQQPSVEAHLVHCLLSSVSRHVRSVSVLSAVPDCMQDCRLVQRAEGRGTSPLLSIFYPSQPWHR